MDEFFHKLSGRPYLEICVISGGIVIRKLFRENDGKKWVYFKDLNMGFIIPVLDDDIGIQEALQEDNIKIKKDSYKFAIKDGKKTTIYYNPDMSTPLSSKDLEEIEKQDLKLIYTINNENKLQKYVYRLTHSKDEYINTKRIQSDAKKCACVQFTPIALDSYALGKMLNSKHFEDIMSYPSEVWEHLGKVLIWGIIAFALMFAMWMILG